MLVVREPRDTVPVLYVILRVQYFCFCLQRAGVLFAACNSFACSELIFVQFFLVCSVREFCLQRVILLLVVCTFSTVRFFFVCSVREFCLQCAILLLVVCLFFYSSLFVCSMLELIFFDVFFMFERIFFICSVFSLLKRCPLWATVLHKPKTNTTTGPRICLE